MSIRHLDRLLEPRSVAVIGASNRPGSVGATVWRNLRAGSFAGPVFGVNPKHAPLDGVAGRPPRRRPARRRPTWRCCARRRDTVPGLIAELGAARHARRHRHDRRPRRAAQKQAALDAARPHLLRLLGPNCLGLLTPHLGLNASFAHTDALPGEIAFVSQSGALVTAVLDWAQSRRHRLLAHGLARRACRRRLRRPARPPGQRRAHPLDPALHRIDRVAAQVHVGGARGGAQQAGDRGQGRPGRQRAAGGRLAHRRAGRLRHRLSTRRSGAPACCASTRCRTCSWRPRRWPRFAATATSAPDAHDQRRRRRRDGRRCRGAGRRRRCRR